MFRRRRRLRREKTKSRIKLGLIALFFLIVLLSLFEFLYINFSFGKAPYLNPLARNRNSNTQNLEKILDKENLNYLSVSENKDGSFLIFLKDGGEVILSSKKDIKSQLSSLQLILSRLTIEGKKLKSLDFRYDNPVVSF
jgi:hypothetical protein